MTCDIIGIGIGPFNLGLAALTADIPALTCLFFEQKAAFSWHPGLLLPAARMQVPYYADLVTLVHPQSRFSYLSFLHAQKRLFSFAIADQLYPLRREYQAYCQWVAAQLPMLSFGQVVTDICYAAAGGGYDVRVVDTITGKPAVFHGKHLVIGTGTIPYIPPCAQGFQHPAVFHAGEYLYKKQILSGKKNISIIGSGQSAAEIFQDLLTNGNINRKLSWFTRSPRFFPMEQSPFAWEMTSPDYVDYFYSLPTAKKRDVVRRQDSLYKGINPGLLQSIYCQLQERCLYPNSELQAIKVNGNGSLVLQFRHTEQDKLFQHETDVLILATGYYYEIPAFLGHVQDHIQWTPAGTYAVNRHYTIDRHQQLFVQNAELYTHGFNSADLGMGPYRNAVILNQILGYEHFSLENNIAFQSFMSKSTDLK
jgi:lysine N6-hydroxylase